MRCVRIGYGKIARIHEEQLRQHGVQTIGILEISPERIRDLEQAGFLAIGSVREAVSLQPDFYDICTPTHARLAILRQLCTLDPQANILIEKPICDFQDIAQIQELLLQHDGLVAVNENYASSNVTLAVKQALASLRINPTRLILESTKNRGADFLAGRFIDTHLGALGYEGSHLLAIIAEFGEGYEKALLLDSDLDNIQVINSGVASTESVLHLNQGGAFMQYQSKNGSIVELYTSMAGQIGFPCPPYAHQDQFIQHEDVKTRYRIVRADGLDDQGVPHQVVGFYEPLKGLQRSLGVMAIFKEWQLYSLSAPIKDNTMSQHLLRVIRFFKGLETNPYSIERGVQDVRLLREWANSCWSSAEDSEEELGNKLNVQKRREDAMRFYKRD
jgi:hypothetical protein